MGKTILEIILKPSWKWLFATPLEIIGVVLFFFPTLGDYINFQHLSIYLGWYWWIIGGLVLFIIITVISTATRISSSQAQKIYMAKIRFKPSDEPHDEIPYISAIVENNEGKVLKCFCVLKSVKYNGIVNDEIKYQITKHTNRISWSGGSDEDVGIKYIDAGGNGTLNIVSLRGVGALVFETAKGKHGKNLETGTYEIDLELRGKVSDSYFHEKPFSICFEYIFDGKPTSVPFHDNVLSGNMGNFKIRLLGKENETAAEQSVKRTAGILPPK